MKGTFPVNNSENWKLPSTITMSMCLRETLSCISKEAGKYNNFWCIML